MDANAIRREVEMTYEKVKSLAGWTVNKDVVLTITSYYVTSEREFDAENLSKAMDAVKEKTGWFSPLRGNLLPMMAAFLDKPGVDIAQEVACLFDKQRILRAVNFSNSIHSYLAALLMTNDITRYDDEARQAKALYMEMKKQHYFLTSDDDYAYAVLLGNRGYNPIEHAKSMRTYYDTLRKERFRGGNELQWMSQIMTYVEMEFDRKYVLKAIDILERFKEQTKVRPIHYPMIGFLAIFDVQDSELQRIIDLTSTLEGSPILKWKREMALSISIGYVMHELTDNRMMIDMGHITSVELMIQAQQAIMAATIAAMAYSTTTNTSDS